MKKIVECVPNFSEGINTEIIDKIIRSIESVEGVKVINVDPGKATNRTVVTFVGEPEPVAEAAFRGIKTASELIDMSKHSGEHPRMGATDVCPFIPVANISMEEAATLATQVAKRVGTELNIPVYLYEASQTDPKKKNLSVIREGEYEGLEKKLKDPRWKPDFGKAEFNPKSGATVIGARDFLIAYNVNLNTKSVKRANSVAFDIREAGRVKTDSVTGKNVLDEKGHPVRVPGKLKGVKAIGWYIKEYGIAQVSINITDFRNAPLHIVFEECVSSATSRGIRVTGSELVGVIPLKALLDAGKYFLKKQKLSSGISEEDLIHIAVKSLGLDELGTFDPQKRIIEYLLRDDSSSQLLKMNLREFANETASESPAPGGGSIAAYAGALGISLATMVANLSSSKKGWEDRWEEFSKIAEEGQVLKDCLLHYVDEDTAAFNRIMEAFSLPKSTAAEQKLRSEAIESATRHATMIPFKVMESAMSSFSIIKKMAQEGNPNSVSDAGVGALCARAAVFGAFLNVKINAASLKDKKFAAEILAKAEEIKNSAEKAEREILEITEEKINVTV